MSSKQRDINKRPEPVGLKDIAAITGVGVVTVHRALTKPDLVAKDTLDRILKTADQLGYVPNRNASLLGGGAPDLLALIVSSVEQPTFADTISGVTEVALDHGLEIILGQTKYDEGRELSITKAMLGRKPSGIIMTFHPSSPKLKKLLKMSNIPVVEVWGGGEGKPVDMSVSISSLKSGQLVADHFHELGKTNPAFFGEDYERDIERWNGFSERWVHLTGGAPPFMLDADVKDRQAGESYRWGNDIITALRENYPEADCLFCTSDITAAGALSAAQRQGLHVPDELAICGSGDLDIAASTYPSLTTVDLSSRKMGTIAANLIIDCLAQKPINPKNVIIHPSLKIRESTVRSL